MNNIVAGLTTTFAGLFIIAICIPLVKRKVKMNRWFGMRLPKSYTSEENWYKINEYGGRQFIYWSIPLALSGVMFFIMPQIGAVQIHIMRVFCLLVCIFVPVIKLIIYSNKL